MANCGGATHRESILNAHREYFPIMAGIRNVTAIHPASSFPISHVRRNPRTLIVLKNGRALTAIYCRRLARSSASSMVPIM